MTARTNFRTTRHGPLAARHMPTSLTYRLRAAARIIGIVAIAIPHPARAQASHVVDGRVSDRAARAVVGASVSIAELHRAVTTSGDGTFRFTGNRSHSVQLEAEAPGLGRTNRQIVRLWFAAQDAHLPEPLRFAGAK